MKKSKLRIPFERYSGHHRTQILLAPEPFRKSLFVALWNGFSPAQRKRFLELTRLETKPIRVEVTQ